MNYYEIRLGNGYDGGKSVWMCIKGTREPTIREASDFCRADVESYKLPVSGVYPIDERTARSCYDFSHEQDWPVFTGN